MSRQAIFFSGPIGVGKTTLGRAVAAQLGAVFLDGDDYSDQHRPWYASSLTTSSRIAEAIHGALSRRPMAIVAYPLRCVNQVYFHQQVERAGHRAIFVTLRAHRDAILSPARGRQFDAAEQERIAQMIAQGYGDRPFSDAIVDTDLRSFDETVAELIRILLPLIAERQ